MNVLFAIGAGLVAYGGYLIWQRKRSEPLLPPPDEREDDLDVEGPGIEGRFRIEARSR